jgi:hypothetical protein
MAAAETIEILQTSTAEKQTPGTAGTPATKDVNSSTSISRDLSSNSLVANKSWLFGEILEKLVRKEKNSWIKTQKELKSPIFSPISGSVR